MLFSTNNAFFIFGLSLGNQAWITFEHDENGATAQLILDGQNITQVNTYQANASAIYCIQYVWTTGEIEYGNHIITVATLADNGESQQMWINLNNFMYVQPHL
jgi:hypothetical protein